MPEQGGAAGELLAWFGGQLMSRFRTADLPELGASVSWDVLLPLDAPRSLRRRNPRLQIRSHSPL